MPASPFKVKAIYDYRSPHDDDLSFPNGQIINVTDVEDADWYYGDYTDSDGTAQQGLFPKNFVEKYEPTTPPRPSRTTRPKKEMEPAMPSQGAASVAATETEDAAASQNVSSPPPALVPKEEEPSSSTAAERSLPVPKPAPNPTPEFPSSTSSAKTTAKPAPTGSSKAVPPPPAEKPSSGSFRDRIAAFNKPAAPPVAPMKPGGLGQSGGSAFVKKPYVAPPPSRNAYVPIPREPPPQKVYRREEDPDVVSKNVEAASAAAPPPTNASTDPEEDQPKPTSLKDRIALLQKQQMEQAARHVEAAQKKEKPKRPPKRQTEPHPTVKTAGNDGEADVHERSYKDDSATQQAGESSYDEHPPRARSSTRRASKSKEATPLASPTRTYHNDPNDADQSGAGDTEDGGDVSTGREDDEDNPRARMPFPTPRAPHLPVREPEVRDDDDGGEERRDEEEEEAEDEEEEEEEIDPEVRKKMEIRERMAKMSGGMGMAGMFGPPGGMPFLPKKPKTSGSSAKEAQHDQVSGGADYTTARNQPLMALPGMQPVRSPEESEKKLEVSKEEEPHVLSIPQKREADEVPDIEDVEPEPPQRQRRAEERGAPPPIPHGTAPSSSVDGII